MVYNNFPLDVSFCRYFVHYNILKKKLNSEDIKSNNSTNYISLNYNSFNLSTVDFYGDYSKIYLNNFLKSELNKNLKTAKIFNPIKINTNNPSKSNQRNHTEYN